MSSDEVINQIIRSIVSHSTDVIKSRNEGKIQNSFNENNTVFVSEEAPPKASEEQGISRLFSQGIHTRVEKYQVTDQFAAFMIRAIVLDSQYRFNVENDMSREEVNRLIKVMIF
jgi:tRNA G37 N-methylase TrmD